MFRLSKLCYASNCPNRTNELIFQYSGNKFASSRLYSTLKEKHFTLAPVAFAKVKIFNSDNSRQIEINNHIVDRFIIPPKPVFCTIQWHETQRLDLLNENQCIVYSLHASKEYYLAVAYNPSSISSVIYVHHDSRGICLHGLKVNSICNNKPNTRLISDDQINNRMFLCMNLTRAHDSFAVDRTDDLEVDLIKVPSKPGSGLLSRFLKLIHFKLFHFQQSLVYKGPLKFKRI